MGPEKSSTPKPQAYESLWVDICLIHLVTPVADAVPYV